MITGSRIEIFPGKTLLGKHLTLSLSENKTRELWQDFMLSKKKIAHKHSTDLYSVQLYDEAYFREFSPSRSFEKWAAMSADSINEIPESLETLEIPAGLYAVFSYQGPVSDAASVFQFIFGTWLPSSGYQTDHRPHFEILGEKYSNESPDSEEEIWVPIKKA